VLFNYFSFLFEVFNESAKVQQFFYKEVRCGDFFSFERYTPTFCLHFVNLKDALLEKINGFILFFSQFPLSLHLNKKGERRTCH